MRILPDSCKISTKEMPTVLFNDAPGHVLIYWDISKKCKIESESKFYFMYTGTYIFFKKKNFLVGVPWMKRYWLMLLR